MAGTFNFGEVILQALDNQKRQQLQEQQLAAEQEYRNKSLGMQQKQMEQSEQQFQQNLGIQQKELDINQKRYADETAFRNLAQKQKQDEDTITPDEQNILKDLGLLSKSFKSEKDMPKSFIDALLEKTKQDKQISATLEAARMGQNSTLSALREQKMAMEKEKKDIQELGWNSLNTLSKVVGSKAYVWGENELFNSQTPTGTGYTPIATGSDPLSIAINNAFMKAKVGNSAKQIESNTKGVKNYLEKVANPLLSLYDETTKKGLNVPGLQERLMVVGDKLRKMKQSVDKGTVSKDVKDVVYNKMIDMTPWINMYDSYQQQQAEANALAEAKAKKQ